MEVSTDNFGRTWNVSLIQTKMVPPRLPQNCVSRLALLDRLSGQRRTRSVTVVTAPAGFGKTTLLAGWTEALSEQEHAVAWLSLDEEDDNPHQLGAYLVAALARASEDIAGQAQQLLNYDALTPIQTVISVLLNGIAACGRNVFLILDDADRLTAKPVVAIVSRLLRYAPNNLHVLLGARGETTLMPGQYRAPESLTRINIDDLRFSIDDAQTFFDQTGTRSLDRTSVRLLNEATEGWVAGLQLASLALGQAGDAAKVADHFVRTGAGIDRYLNDTVLAHLPPSVLKFLLNTSILERLSPAVCDAVMGGRRASASKLDWLERHNVFIRRLDERHEWYRYHALLSDALRRRLIRQMPHEVPLLHGRACRWFAQANLWPEAVRHALAAGELELAAQWVEHCAMEMLERGDPHTLLAWIGRLPPEVLQGRLRLRLAKAWALGLSLQITHAVREMSSVTGDIERMLSDDSGSIDDGTLTEANAVGALIAAITDDSERALELGRTADASTAPVAPWVKRCAQTMQFYGLMYRGKFDEILRIRNVAKNRMEQSPDASYSDMVRNCMFGLAALIHGDFPEARRTLEMALPKAEKLLGRSAACTVALSCCLSTIYYECNELERTREMISGRTAVALEACPVGSLIRHTFAASRLLWREGETGSALAVLEDGRQVAITRQWSRLKLACDVETVRLLIEGGNLVEARRIANDLSASLLTPHETRPGSAVETWTSYSILNARVLLAENLPDQAVNFLARSLDTVAGMGWRYQEAVISLLLAVAFEQCGAADQALVTLRRALRLGEPIGIITSFVDEGPKVRALLQRFRRDPGNASSDETTYADRLLSAFHKVDAAPASLLPTSVVTAAGAMLSTRELEVLHYVARGLSNKEIGRLMKVAPETIKWHLKNIFDKLDVSSRIEAVQTALGHRVAADRRAPE
ncbi:LuxR C-terminal-related transcriptional regulator [Paraburkholderia sp. BL21I4N1]|uniref:LuxR C-terminal-related transcriptional regulator n=1 Tax=Paraburkholderia sp. BL21I4N1 TaxID=1938801 RepID=UPI000CFC9B96|nr:LuxR C-terminal-related transcriptional regulator [Paraburkholderia sp. BL21I4N1]PQV50648.1 LuxR family maltose regulon positive regulatory protein [Paraburkholderia sp. BL21I4N1]